MRKVWLWATAVVWSVFLGGAVARPVLPVAAQTFTGAICVSTFADLNANGVPEPDEPPLAGVNVNLSTGGVIIATHVSEANETAYCFENLLRGRYTVTFTDAPTYRMTTPHTGTFTLDEGQRLTLDPFGAYPIALSDVRAELLARQAAYASSSAALSTSARLLLATGGAALVMLSMIGLGIVILFAWRGNRPFVRS